MNNNNINDILNHNKDLAYEHYNRQFETRKHRDYKMIDNLQSIAMSNIDIMENLSSLNELMNTIYFEDLSLEIQAMNYNLKMLNEKFDKLIDLLSK